MGILGDTLIIFFVIVGILVFTIGLWYPHIEGIWKNKKEDFDHTINHPKTSMSYEEYVRDLEEKGKR